MLLHADINNKRKRGCERDNENESEREKVVCGRDGVVGRRAL